jgi:hypothetical protein
MANCGKCAKEVGCGCNLVHGLCMSCYNEGLDSSAPQMRTTSRQTYNLTLKQPVAPTEFETILNSPTMTKQEKLNRINDIINNASTSITQ